ncbi:UDP-N-acetylmuramate--L-alanine ligase isoform X3 [Desmodus rotundus]|uniref:UDP-N-acetylmuramate--L-alanine ligase isoform X3 n=1 Tax=Desmodus rotundus TaxID=9430 RepID=UPI0023812C51|nr:transcription initiation factor TFIID subunit 4-like isoform X3 [Desmodus rotundus]
MQIWERGDLRQVELILSWATPLPQPRLGRPPSRRTPPSPAAAAARECKAGRREAARRAALCFGTGPARRGGPVARTVRATPREQLRAAHGARLAVLRPPHLSALAASTAPAAPPEPTDPNGVSTGARESPRSRSPTSVHLGARSAPPELLVELWLQHAPEPPCFLTGYISMESPLSHDLLVLGAA